MNEDERNERERSDLERLIAAARPIGPSEELDARVRKALLDGSGARAKRGEPRPDRRLSLTLAASVLVAAGIGFLCGRLTAQPEGANLVASDALPPGDSVDAPEAPEIPPSVTRAPLQDERLASLFLPTRAREGLLGAGPIRVEISRLP